MRIMASEEYNAAPGFYRSTSTTATAPQAGDFVRFDGVSPDADGNLTLVVDVLDQPSDTRAAGVNAIQLVLNAPNPGAPPAITQDLQPTVGPAGGAVTLSVTATGTGLTYQPNALASGSDSFTYTISDVHGGSASATVSVTITHVNRGSCLACYN
jgi:hypothetical protein